MAPKREEFILDVRRAARLAEKPTVITSSGLANPDVIAKTLHGAAARTAPSMANLQWKCVNKPIGKVAGS